jgi:hypothetical protein
MAGSTNIPHATPSRVERLGRGCAEVEEAFVGRASVGGARLRSDDTSQNERSERLSDMTKLSNVMRWTRWARCLRRTTSTLAELIRVAVKRAFEGASKCRLYQWS